MEQTKKIVKYISDSLSNISSIIFNSSTQHDDEDEVEINAINSLTSQEWSKDNVCDETIIIKKNDYDKLLSEISYTRMQLNNFKMKEREYTRMKNDYDKTVTYLLNNDRNGKHFDFVNKTRQINTKNELSENEVKRFIASEMRLKSHIKALKKDLFDSEQRAETFKCMANADKELLKEEIVQLNKKIETEKEHKKEYVQKIRRLEDILQNRCEETVELIEYCRYLMK